MATHAYIATFADQAWSSGNLSNNNAVATIPAVVDQYAVLTGFTIAGGGATAGGLVDMTITGTAGSATLHFEIPVATGITAPIVASQGQITVTFQNEIQASAKNTAIVGTLPALGTGNTNASLTLMGHYRSVL